MLRDLVNKLSGGQITLIILAMIFVPGTVVAAVSFQPVAIVDPATGKRSLVDDNRRLAVYDEVAGYRSNPAAIVRFSVSNFGDACEAKKYVVPSGRALVLTAISGYELQYNTSPNSAGYFIYDTSNCTGNVLTTHFTSVSTSSPIAPVSVELGSGIVVPAGKTISVRSVNNYGYTFLHGYLVPATALRPVASADEEPGLASVTAAEVAAKMKHR